MIDQFYNTTDDDNDESESFIGYNNESISEIYLQITDACRDYNTYIANSSLLESIENRKELISMISEYGACDSVCATQVVELFCLPFTHHNGVCDGHCFLADCGWDGGDCNQLCDFDTCQLSNWTNGYCDVACNSTECHWDGYDCGTDGLVCPTNCSATWINDGYCITLCLEPDGDDDSDGIALNSSKSIYQQCYDLEKEYDCTECSQEGSHSCWFMYSAWEIAILAATGLTLDEQANEKIDVLSGDGWCNLQMEFQDYWITFQNTLGVDKLNCNNITMNPKYDLNMNNVTGLFEFYYMFVKHLHEELPEYIIHAIDCSFCLYNKSNYYL